VHHLQPRTRATAPPESGHCGYTATPTRDTVSRREEGQLSEGFNRLGDTRTPDELLPEPGPAIQRVWLNLLFHHQTLDMPRDLSALIKEDTLQGMPQLTKSPEAVDERSPAMDATDEDEMVESFRPMRTSRDELHPYTQTLSISDVDSCTKLEEEAFPPNERCSREKFQYRLRLCGEMSMGIFTSHSDGEIPTAHTSAPVYSGAPQRKAVLLGHIVATKSTNRIVTDKDMMIPLPDATQADPSIGHNEEGRTVCIHSLAVLPGYRKRGLGRTLMAAYLHRMETQGVVDRAALIAHANLIPFYESLGFKNLGPSECKFGGGGWYDLVKELKSDSDGVPGSDEALDE